MKKTENYELNKPEASDFYDIEHFNENAEKIDKQLKENQIHRENKENPHNVTKKQIGLENVPNVDTNDQTPTYTAAKTNTDLKSGENLSVAMGKIAKAVSSLISHLANTSNPHGVTKSQVGLGNVDNTADADKPVSTAQQAVIDGAAVAKIITGKSPQLPKSTCAPFITFKGKGETEQQTYIGKNLFDEVNYNKFIYPTTIGADLTTTASYRYGVTDLIDGSKDITISCVDGSSANSVIVPLLWGITDNKIAKYTHSFGSNKTFKGGQYDYWIVGFGLTKDTTLTTDDLINAECMVEIGTTKTDYEPYVGGIASPNPDYPQEIHGVGESGVLEVKSTGKNIINQDAIITDTYVNESTGKQSSIAECRSTDFIPVQEGESYYFSGMSTLNLKNSGAMYDKNKVYVKGISDYVDMQPLVVPKGVAYIRISLWEKYFTDFSKVQLEKGTVATTYEPYQGEATASIPLSAPLYEGDYIRLNMDGSGELIRRWKKVVFDGSENWSYWTNSTNRNYAYQRFSTLGLPDGLVDKNRVCVLSDHFKGVAEIGDNYDEITIGHNNDDNSWLWINTFIHTSAAEWKAWLAENPITVVYELSEPTVTPLTAEQIAEFEKLRTFDGVTNVTCEGECEVQYLTESESGKAVAAVVSKVNNGLDALEAAINKAIADLINGAPGTLDTLKEIADAMAENEDVVEALEKAIGERAKTTDLTAHTGNKSNPHGVTKAQVGLGNVNNTSDADKPVSTAQQAAINKAIAYDKGVIAEFDYETGEISDAVEANMTVPTVIDHLQAVISDIIGGVMANKENLELPVGSVIMMETGTGTNYELPKYGTWEYQFNHTIESTSGGVPVAEHVKLYKRTS